MKRSISLLLSIIMILGLITGCSPAAESDQEVGQTDVNEMGNLKIVATNSILSDMAKNVGGEYTEVYSVVPVGTDPHEYEPLPADIQACEGADIVFYNGLNLETGNGWFDKLMETTEKVENEDYYAVSTGVEPQYLTSAGQEGEEDPHAWLNISNGIIYVENMAQIMAEHDPANADAYHSNADVYIDELKKLDLEAKDKFNDIPAEQKLLVTSEGAFKYFSAAYGLTAAYIWEINTENQGTPEQMKSIINTINQWEVPVLFVETSVDSRSMEQVSEETGLSIYSNIFTDSLADTGEEGDTYYSMMEWNLNKIHEGLTK